MSSSSEAPEKTLLERLWLEADGSGSAVGGVVPRGVVPIEAGERRELEFNGSAEC